MSTLRELKYRGGEGEREERREEMGLGGGEGRGGREIKNGRR